MVRFFGEDEEDWELALRLVTLAMGMARVLLLEA